MDDLAVVLQLATLPEAVAFMHCNQPSADCEFVAQPQRRIDFVVDETFPELSMRYVQQWQAVFQSGSVV